MRFTAAVFSLIFFSSLLANPVTAEEKEAETIIIGFENEIDEGILSDIGMENTRYLPSINAVIGEVKELPVMTAAIEPSIEYIEQPPLVYAAAQTPSWGYQVVNGALSLDLNYIGEGVSVAVVDTGIDHSHPDLNLVSGVSTVEGETYSADLAGHGTQVAGIIAAQNNEIGTIGLVPGVSLYSIKALNRQGVGTVADLVEGLQWAIDQDIDVINLSITLKENSKALEEMVKQVDQNGTMMIAASGNYDQVQPVSDVLYPAKYPEVIAVGSINQQQFRSYFSYSGESLEFVAPGENIYTTQTSAKSSLYTSSVGTSFATPFVTGVAAQYKSAYPHLSNDQIRRLMRTNALDMGIAGRDRDFGFGLIQPIFKPTGVFYDIPASSWYSSSVNKLVGLGAVNGSIEGTYKPFEAITRGEAIKIIGSILGLDEKNSSVYFTDVPSSYFAAGLIASSYEAGYVTGYSNKTFGPRNTITRAELVTMIARIFEFEETAVPDFPDVRESAYYYSALQSVVASGVVEGYPDGTFRPSDPVTRAAFAKIISGSLRVIE